MVFPLWSGFKYFPHQLEGINWMIDKENNGTRVWDPTGTKIVDVYGGFQCDDMGLGKTIQIVSTIANNPEKLTLILAPLAMVETWSSVCKRAGFSVYEVEKSKWICKNPNSKCPIRFLKLRPNVYVTNYEKLIHNPTIFAKHWDRIILDEAHKIRNGSGQFAKSVRSLSASIRWVVTGTPLVNSLKDIVSLLAFLGVPYTPSFSWSSHYMKFLPRLLIHRSMESIRSVIKGAPPIPEIVTEVLPFISEEEEEFYKGVQCADEALLKKYARDVMTSVQSFQLLLRLRQLSVHPQVYINAKRREDSSYDRDNWGHLTTKFERVKDIISEDDDDRVHKYIVFCQFMEEMEMLAAELDEFIPHVLMYHGSLKQSERTQVLATSKATTKTTVLLLQLQAGGVGLNLQEYDRIIFVSPWWTSALMDQAIARAVRMGQTEVVKVYHLKLALETENSALINIDETMHSKADEKRRMLEKIFTDCAKALEATKVAAETLAETLDETLVETLESAETLQSAEALEPGQV